MSATIIASAEIIATAVPDTHAVPSVAPRLFAIPIPSAAGRQKSENAAVKGSPVRANESRYADIGESIADIVELFLPISI